MHRLRARRPILALLAASALVSVGCQSEDSHKDSGQAPQTGDAYWIASWVPQGFELLLADDREDGSHVAAYGPPERSDPYEGGPLSVVEVEGTAAQIPWFAPEAGAGRDEEKITVRGHPGVLRTVMGEGGTGHAIAWREPGGTVLAVLADRSVSDSALRRVADGVRPVSRARWQRLVRATSPEARIGRPSSDMERVTVTRGRHRDRPWVLTALLPRDYPLGPEDRRAACYELAYRGEGSTGTACTEHPSWARVGGAIFVFGEADPSTKRIRVTDLNGPSRRGRLELTAKTFAAPRGPPIRFYALPLPEGNCGVTVEPIDGPGVHLGQTGPLLDAPDHRRCLR